MHGLYANTPKFSDGLVFHPSRQTTLDAYKVRVAELLAVLMPKQHTVRVQIHAFSIEVRLRNTGRYRQHA
jgi:hypothetical protein